MIPKGVGTNFQGIDMVEVLWKEISNIINRRLFSSIRFHDVLHGFHAGRGKGNATLEANILQQLISMKDIVLRAIFLYLRKVYDALDR